MAETRFTPGPWTVQGHLVLAGRDGRAVIHRGTDAFGSPYIGDLPEVIEVISGQTRAANAHLIAAAPRLYEELETMRSHLHELHALVMGECPALLNEDSGGDAELALAIIESLQTSDVALTSARGGTDA